jgi:hypothetical protein
MACRQPFFMRAGERTRTADPLFTRQALCQLSYSGGEAEFNRGSAGLSGGIVYARRSTERASPSERRRGAGMALSMALL